MRFLIQLFRHKMPVNYYAVANGRRPGVYNTWEECKYQTDGYSKSDFKKFSSEAQAESFMQQHSTSSQASSNTSKANNKTAHVLLLKGSYSKLTARPILSFASRVPYTPKIIVSIERKDHASTLHSLKQRTVPLVDDLPTDCQNCSFNTDPDGYINVFTDGACSSNGIKGATAGIGVWFGDNHGLNLSEPVIGRATNNMAEIQAVTLAALQARRAGITKLQINTDSQFLISCITIWIKRWKTNGWMTTNNRPVINKTELVEMEKALSGLDVHWNHINGHVGIYGNEMANKLARAGCKKYRDAN